MSLSQKDAVFSAIQTHFGTTGRSFVEGERVELSRDERAAVTEIIVNGINSGDVAFSADAAEKHNSPEKLRSYVTGMIGNWLTKDKRLNGGEKYSPKNPGSRVGQGDEVLKNLKAFRSTLSDPDQLAAVDLEIENRKKAIASEKNTKKVSVDFDKIPADLLSSLNISK